ncbi:MAG: F0F1 ATP synthase subunit A [Microscillaceae bacterium]|nr:F0F1 ATP synthase subunit A [Microscillaceae bacterium]MDW8460976.1 F0F1 ATP synthase subunit A [Cytophagales bacterium]
MCKSFTKRARKALTTSLLATFFVFFTIPTQASGEEGKEFSPGEMILHHIADSHEWHFFSIGNLHISLPLPVILIVDGKIDIFLSSEFHHAKIVEITHEGEKVKAKKLVRGENTYLLIHDKIKVEGDKMLIDLSITKNVTSLFLSVILMFWVFTSVAKGYKVNAGKPPKGIQAFFEPIIVYIRDEIAIPALGDKHEKYLPYLLTLFFFIWFNNLLGLMPGGANLTGNIAVTMTLAVLTFLITTFTAKKAYWSHIFTPPVPLPLYIIMIPVEIIGIFTKPFSLMVRLFANITAGHTIILSLLALIFIFGQMNVALGFGVGIFSVAFAVAMNMLELFVAILQAYVFTLLSAMYFANAIEEHHHEGHEHEHHHAHNEEVKEYVKTPIHNY